MEENTNEPRCVYCERDSNQVPLLVLWNNGQNYWICPEHLPILIHRPELLRNKLPGATGLKPGTE